MTACSENSAPIVQAQEGGAARAESAVLGLEATGAGTAFLMETDLINYSNAALDGDGQAAFMVMMHYQMALLDRRNAEYWAQIAAENGSLDGAVSYASYLVDVRDKDQCRRARFWARRAAEIAGDKEHQSAKIIEKEVAEKCAGL